MKNNLLITTALVMLVSAGNIHAAERPTYYATDLTQQGVDPNNPGGMSGINSVLNSATVVEGGQTTINNAGLIFTNVVGQPNAHNKGELITESQIDPNKTGTFTMSGGDLTMDKVEVAADKTVIMTGGTLTSTDTNVTAKEEISLKTDGQLTMNSTNLSSEKSITLGGNVAVNGETTWKADEINFDGVNGTINSSSLNIIANSEGKNPNLTFIGENSFDRKDGNGLDVYGANVTIQADSSLNFTQDGSAGTLTIHDIEGSTVTNNGTLKMNLVMDGGTYNSNAATLDGDLTATAGTVNLGDKASTVTGTATFGEASILAVTVGKNSQGSLTANDFDIADGATMKLTLENGVVGFGASDVQLDVLKKTAGGKIDNNFTIDSNNMYEFEIGENGEILATNTTTAAEVVSSAGGSANDAAVATAWNAAGGFTAGTAAASMANHLIRLAQNDATAYKYALKVLAPEVTPLVQKTEVENMTNIFTAVSSRLSGGAIASAADGKSSGDAGADKGAVWVKTLANKSKLDDTSKAKGFDADSYSIALGAEKSVSDNAKIGIGYAYTNTDIDGFMRTTDVDTHTAMVYGEYKPGNWYVNGIAAYGWSDYKESKNVAGMPVKADYDVETFGLQAMTGYDMQIGGFDVTPEAGLRYVHIKQDGYRDSVQQKVSVDDSDILTGVVGAKVGKTVAMENGMTLRPEARLAMTYDLMNDDNNSVVTLANGSAYTVNGEKLDRFGIEVGAGLTADVSDNIELSVGYEGKFREDYQDHTGLLNAKYKF